MADPDFSRVTFVFSMPRARSRWLSWFFRTNGVTSWHDPLSQCTSPADLLSKVRAHLWHNPGPLVLVDTGAIFFQCHIRLLMPGMKRAYLFRNPEDVADSIWCQTRQDKTKLLQEQNDRMYLYAFDDDNNFRIQFGLIDQRLPEFWQFVTGSPMPVEVAMRCNECSSTKVDVPLSKQVPDLYKMRQLSRHREEK